MRLSRSQTQVHPFTRRGFFSEYLMMLWVLLYCRRNDIAFELAVTGQSLISARLAAELFNVNMLPSAAARAFMFRHRLSEKVRRYPFLAQGALAPAIWRSLWNGAYEARLSEQIDLVAELNALHSETWKFPACASLLGGSVQPGRYVALHIRRGDKMIREAQFVAADVFLSLIPETFRTTPIVVLSDDFSAVAEVQESVASAGLGVDVYTPVHAHAEGYSNRDFLKRSVAEREKDIRQLLIEFDLLCRSAFTVCSFSSNVGRAVHIARRGQGTASVDTAFRFVQ
jgi:hypothetical protein